jgi:hypothetical protein
MGTRRDPTGTNTRHTKVRRHRRSLAVPSASTPMRPPNRPIPKTVPSAAGVTCQLAAIAAPVEA